MSFKDEGYFDKRPNGLSGKPSAKDNSIDSELEEIIEKAMDWHGYYDEAMNNLSEEKRQFVESTSWAGELHKAERKKLILQAIKSLYISRKEIEEALKDETYDDLVMEDNKMHQAIWEGRNIRNKFRAELRTKLEQLFNEKEK